MFVFQVWILSYDIGQKDQMPQKSGWKCRSVGSYKYVPALCDQFTILKDLNTIPSLFSVFSFLFKMADNN